MACCAPRSACRKHELFRSIRSARLISCTCSLRRSRPRRTSRDASQRQRQRCTLSFSSPVTAMKRTAHAPLFSTEMTSSRSLSADVAWNSVERSPSHALSTAKQLLMMTSCGRGAGGGRQLDCHLLFSSLEFAWPGCPSRISRPVLFFPFHHSPQQTPAPRPTLLFFSSLTATPFLLFTTSFQKNGKIGKEREVRGELAPSPTAARSSR